MSPSKANSIWPSISASNSNQKRQAWWIFLVGQFYTNVWYKQLKTDFIECFLIWDDSFLNHEFSHSIKFRYLEQRTFFNLDNDFVKETWQFLLRSGMAFSFGRNFRMFPQIRLIESFCRNNKPGPSDGCNYKLKQNGKLLSEWTAISHFGRKWISSLMNYRHRTWPSLLNSFFVLGRRRKMRISIKFRRDFV